MGRLNGKVAIVTGAGRGIGAEHATLLAAQGAAVVVNDIGARDGADAAAVVAAIVEAGGTASADRNSATWDGAAEIVASAIDTYGRLDILINNATAGRNNDLWNYSEDEWDLSNAVNLKGYAAMIQAATEPMVRGGGGAIVNTSSGSGFGHPSHAAYATAKEGVIGLTRTAAMELGRFGVRCNAVRPLAVTQQFHEYRAHSAPWRPLMEATMGPSNAHKAPDAVAAHKVAPFVVWLCTDAACNVNGRSFMVAGDRVSLLSEPAPEATIEQRGGWTLDDLDAAATSELVADLANRFTLDEYPELQVFPTEG